MFQRPTFDFCLFPFHSFPHFQVVTFCNHLQFRFPVGVKKTQILYENKILKGKVPQISILRSKIINVLGF